MTGLLPSRDSRKVDSTLVGALTDNVGYMVPPPFNCFSPFREKFVPLVNCCNPRDCPRLMV
jgi:hypothetical protein